MHYKLYVPSKQVAILGRKWAYFVTRVSHPPNPALMEFQWEFTGDYQTAESRMIEVANKYELRGESNILAGVCAVQYADKGECFLPMQYVMNTTPYTLHGLSLSMHQLAAEIVKHYELQK